MSKEKKLLIDYFPPLRDKAEEETTPDYLNYISDTIDQSHQTLLMEQSPYYKILNIFNTKKPLGLDDIQNIFSEVKNPRDS